MWVVLVGTVSYSVSMCTCVNDQTFIWIAEKVQYSFNFVNQVILQGFILDQINRILVRTLI